MRHVLFILWVLVSFSSCKVATDETPLPVIIYPEAQTITNGNVLFLAENQNEAFDAEKISDILFEISNNGENWTPIEHSISWDMSSLDLSSPVWEATLDVSEVPSGDYRARVSISNNSGLQEYSKEVPFFINKPPMVTALAYKLNEQGTVQFDASQSVDPEGQAMQYEWDFGDGQNAVGKEVEHTYDQIDTTYLVSLVVKDQNDGDELKEYELDFGKKNFRWYEGTKRCICKKVVLRGDNLEEERKAFGPDAAPGGTTWDDRKYFATKTLGPQDDNPNNPKHRNSEEKRVSGYGFEVYFKVEGDPKYCKEDQLLKGTLTQNDKTLTKTKCEKRGGIWDPKAKTCTTSSANFIKVLDKDQDGIVDLDVSTPAKCAANGGKWLEKEGLCMMLFPVTGTKYGSDGYRKEFSFKKHFANEVIWFDAPNFRGSRKDKNGTGVKKGDFVAYLRGTDGKFCYSCYSLKLVKKKGKDEETLVETDNKVGAIALPKKVE